MNAHTGDKLQVETDYSSGGFRPLEVRRTYSSSGFPWLVNSTHPDFGMSSYWRLNFHHRLVQYTGAAYTTMVAARTDNAALYFYRSGATWNGRPEQTEKLVDNLDGGGVVVSRTLTLSDNSSETYDTNGRLVSIQDASGWTQVLAYDGSGRLQSVTDSIGRVLAFSYDGAGKLASISTPDQQSIAYAFSDSGRLTSVTWPGAAQKQYLYREAAHVATNAYGDLLTGIVDENGDRYATYKYNSSGQVSQTEHGNGVQRYQFTYGATATIVDPLGTTRTLNKTSVKGFARTTSVSQPCASCGGGAASAFTYDTLGNLASRTDFRSKKTCYAYDTIRNLETARLEGATSTENCTTVLATPPNRPDVRKVTTTWHATWRLPATIVEPAPGGTKSTAFTYDASGNLTQKRITAPKNDGTATTITRTWKWTYGTFGRVLTATDPNNRVTTTTWHSDTDPDLGKRGQVATVTNPLGHVTQYTAYDAGNRVTSMTDPNGLVTTMTYDLRGRLTSRSVGGETTTYDYDLAGLLTDVDMPDGSSLSYVYDAAHRLTEVHDGLGNKIVYTLDGMGNRTAEQAYDPAGVLARTRTRVYDSLNRLAQEVGAQSQATVMTYDGNGNRLTTADPLTRVTTNTYDALNRLLTVTDPGNGLTQYVYDPSGNLTSVTDPRNLVTAYGYDGLGNQVAQVSPDTGTTTRTFDSAGNLKTSTDARGAKATYTYDVANRVTRIAYTQTGFTTENHTYTWDGGTTGAPNAKGRITKLVDPSGTTAWTFAPQGRVASRSQTAGGVTLTTSYAWANGRLTGMTTPSGQQLAYAWTNGRISGIALNGAPLIGSGDYEPFGPVSVWQWANGHKTYRDHDLDGRLASWEYRNGASILRRDLTWDHANRITAITDPASAANSSTYGYDVLDRLTSALSGGAPATSRGYGYDAIGNRTTSTVDAASTTYAYPPTSHRLTSLTGATTKSYTYDGAGNPTQAGLLTYGYNLANRMASVSGGASATYKVNALGQRVAKTIGTTTTRYVYDEQGRLIGEYGQSGALIQETIWLDDLPIATLRPTGTGNPTPVAVYYVHADHLGSPRAITRPSDDAILWRWDNDEPFGNNAANESPSGQGNFRYDLRFPGQQFDAETGTHYNYFRDYEPSIGRYLQSDPIGLRGGVNTYAYVYGSPINLSDAQGLNPGMGGSIESCDWYAARCAESGGTSYYYCRAAPFACRYTPPSPWTRCVRQCVQDFDRACSRNADGSPSTDCVMTAHAHCWRKCAEPLMCSTER